MHYNYISTKNIEKKYKKYIQNTIPEYVTEIKSRGCHLKINSR